MEREALKLGELAERGEEDWLAADVVVLERDLSKRAVRRDAAEHGHDKEVEVEHVVRDVAHAAERLEALKVEVVGQDVALCRVVDDGRRGRARQLQDELDELGPLVRRHWWGVGFLARQLRRSTCSRFGNRARHRRNVWVSGQSPA